MEQTKIYDLEERLLNHAVRIVRVVETLADTTAGGRIADQLMRCGTSPYPHHGEAQAAESTKDFVHKMKICLKELKETIRWLKLVRVVPLVDSPNRLDDLIDETDQLIRIFATSIKTSEGKQ